MSNLSTSTKSPRQKDPVTFIKDTLSDPHKSLASPNNKQHSRFIRYKHRPGLLIVGVRDIWLGLRVGVDRMKKERKKDKIVRGCFKFSLSRDEVKLSQQVKCHKAQSVAWQSDVSQPAASLPSLA